MLKRDEFIDFILNGPGDAAVVADAGASALPEGLEGFGFDTPATPSPTDTADSSFAKRLLEASGFGLAKQYQRDSLIRSSDAVARHLPSRVSFWDKSSARPYRTLLFEADIDHAALLKIPAFKSRRMAHLDDVEGALSRFVAEALDGFQRGGEGVTADVVKGRKEETLCVISILDKRDGDPVRLICFGTQNAQTGGLETFRITEQTRNWEPHLAREHLGLLYERQFKKLSGQRWQEAFTTTEERKQANKLLELGSLIRPTEAAIQECVLGLLDTIAKGFGLRKKSKDDKLRLRADQLPPDHDIGMEPETRENEAGGKNPFRGVTLRDEKSRLLGYIVYPLNNTSDADRLRAYLEEHNRFHNVLVVYPDKDETRIELWQGTDQLQGKLRRGQGYKDAAEVVNLLSRFFVVSKAKVSNPPELAKELAYRARYLRSIALEQLEQESDSGELRALHSAFKEALVHDQTEADFADAFAQTLTYSLLTARWVLSAQGGKTGDRFTRKAAMKKLAIGSRFLSEMFTAVLSMQFDKQNRLHWLVDDLTGLLDRVDVVSVFQDDGSDLTADPIIHFYEPFLQEYDAQIRMQRGVFYTPKPVVSYIVRSVDELLRTEFGLEDGLADTATWGDMVKRMDGLEIPEGASADQGFVQILDPATGTGTFLVEVIGVIHATMVKKWTAEGHNEAKVLTLWNKYVPDQLLPRLYGYELMMAPYAVAHLKIGLKLHDTGYAFGSEVRTQVYLTNALDPGGDKQFSLGFMPALAHEAQAVNEIKKDRRFTVVVGNPPYSGISSNMSEHAQRIVDGYKFVDGAPLNERKIWLQDDYVKFIRTAQTSIENAHSGVFGFITNNGYFGNPTFRGMRQSLMATFPRLEVLDLHGNANKKEKAPDGSVDKNVFDIRQGVGICLATRGGATSTYGHADAWGSREGKYSFLTKHTVGSTVFLTLAPDSPYYFFEPQDTQRRAEYDGGWKITEAFPLNSAGFITARDHFVMDFDADALLSRIGAFANAKLSDSEIRTTYFSGSGSDKYPDGDTRGWKLPAARHKVQADKKWTERVVRCLYRPFDFRFVYWADWMVDWPRPKVMGQMLGGDNRALLTARSNKTSGTDHFFCSAFISETKCAEYSTQSAVFPLYILPSASTSRGGLALSAEKQPNLAPRFLADIASALNVPREGPHQLPRGLVAEDIFHYAYAVFYSPVYRTRYVEFLKKDFPRLPLVGSLALFRSLARLGEDLTTLHLMESARLEKPITTAVGSGDFQVEKVSHSDETVWLDKAKTRGFKGVPENVWKFHIGGYQVCEKWLKDRQAKGGKKPRPARTLTDEDIAHYQKIIVAISETIRIMGEIDEVIEAHGGWPGAFVTENEGDA